MRVGKSVAGALVLLLASLPATFAADPGGPLTIPLNVEALPDGASLPRWDRIELARNAAGRYDVRLVAGAASPEPLVLRDADLSLLIPRAPKLVHGNESLTRLALIQREFNRNEVHNPLPDGRDFSIANNCLERGLWEVKVARSDSGKTATLFHAWFTFPEDEYAKLFRLVNDGLDWAAYAPALAKYPGVGGFPLSLDDLRRPVPGSERELAGLDVHAAGALERLPEQAGKVKHIRTANLETYADVARPERQPVTLAKFNAPGRYDPAEAMKFDLRWLGSPTKVLWREVSSRRPSGAGAKFTEVEIRFANGLRILAADPELARLPARAEPPRTEADVLKFVCGIGTPVIHATAAERAAELSADRPRYLMILDAAGNHVDNHLTGVDGLYAWRDASNSIHLWLVSYERIAFVAHVSAKLPDGV